MDTGSDVHKLKIGDRVRFISTNDTGPVVGSISTVTRVYMDDGGLMYTVKLEDGGERNFFHWRFEKVDNNMVDRVKRSAEDINTWISPYKRYIGLIALALTLDHFILDGKYTDKFRSLVEAIVIRITDSLDNLIGKLQITEEEDKVEVDNNESE